MAGVGGAAALLPWLPGCGGSDDGTAGAAGGPTEGALAAGAEPPLQTLYTGLNHPWSLAWLPDGSALVTERNTARLLRFSADGRRLVASIGGLPQRIHVAGQGGLLDVAVDTPNGDTWVYLSYSEHGTADQAGNVGLTVARGRLVGNALHDTHVIFRARPKVPISVSTAHYGARLALAGSNQLFISHGERQASSERPLAQSLGKHHGKILRINRDGSVPTDNPFVGVPGAKPEIWSLGHRNPQGLAIHPATGELWESEHGPQGGDEVNVILKGRNYGWPRVSYGCEYGTPVGACPTVGGATAAPGLEPPVTTWVPTSIAPSGIAFCSGAMFPEWQNHLFVSALAGTALWRLELDGHRLVSRTELYSSQRKRIRAVKPAPDGSLWLLTDDSAGQILRVAR